MLEPVGDVFDIPVNESATIKVLLDDKFEMWEIDYNADSFMSIWLNEDVEITIGDRRIYFSKIGK
jgi:hypothetical protein